MELLIKLRDIFQELRWYQWYKNLLVFLALLWVSHATFTQINLLGVGFVALCISSSIVYLFNDLKDVELDKQHPLKKKRPLAAGVMNGIEAYSLLLVLTGILFILLALIGNATFSGIVLIQFVVNLAYTFGLKHISYVDLFTLASLMMVRAVAGFILLGINVPIFALIAVFALWIFIMSMQRLAELDVVGTKARPALMGYTPHMLRLLLTTSMMVTTIFYFITFAFISLPIAYTDVLYFLALMTINDYMNSETTKKELAQNEFLILFSNKRLLTFVVLLILVIVTILLWFK